MLTSLANMQIDRPLTPQRDAVFLGFLALALMACGSATIKNPPDGGGGRGGAAGAGGATGAAGAGGVAGAAGTGGTAGAAGQKDGGTDTAPVSCVTGGTCPAGTVCSPQNVCVDCSAITATLPATPQLRGPMRGAYTGSLHAPSARATLRPTFTWAAVAPTCGAVSYELQLDNSCTPGSLASCAFSSAEVDAKGITATSYAPPQDLKVATTAPVGALYAWRVRACDASNRCGSWSEVRYLHVGRVREDINGDGYGDLLAGSSRGIEVYLGSSQFDVTDSSNAIAYTSGVPPTFSGDVNGDGYGDFFGASSYSPTAGYVPTLYLGGPDVTSLSTVLLTKTAGGPSTLMQTTSAGDFNGDGFADLIVQWGYGTTTPQTELRIFFGGTTLANMPDLSIPGPYASFYTLQYSGRVGDLNGDGFEDIALTARSDDSTSSGVIQIFAGGAQPVKTPAASIATTSTSTYAIKPAGDLNSDGYGDAVIVLAGTGYYLYSGASKLAATFTTTWADTTASDAVGTFDIDGDGFPDLAIGTTGQAVLYRGTATGPTQVSGALSHISPSVMIGASDNDGDGLPDLVATGGQMSGAFVEWAGSDGTTNPRTFNARLSATGAQLSGFIVR